MVQSGGAEARKRGRLYRRFIWRGSLGIVMILAAGSAGAVVAKRKSRGNYKDKSRHKVSADLKNSRTLLLRGSAVIRSRIYDYRYSSGSMERITSLV